VPSLLPTPCNLGRFSNNPSNEHWSAVIRVLKYVAGTLDYGLVYNKSSSTPSAFSAYSDSDWGSCVNTSRSTMGYVFLLAGGAVSWSSKRQSRVAASSSEAEYISLSHTCKEAIHLQQLLGELHYPIPAPITIFGDNQGANALSKDPKFQTRTKHIRLSEHFVREHVVRKEVEVKYIPTLSMIADTLTKSLPRPAFEMFRKLLGVLPSSLWSKGGSYD
jgi:hypothetical protein